MNFTVHNRHKTFIKYRSFFYFSLRRSHNFLFVIQLLNFQYCVIVIDERSNCGGVKINCNIKGQLISKGLFGIHDFFKKSNVRIYFQYPQAKISNSIVRFLEETLRHCLTFRRTFTPLCTTYLSCKPFTAQVVLESQFSERRRGIFTM